MAQKSRRTNRNGWDAPEYFFPESRTLPPPPPVPPEAFPAEVSSLLHEAAQAFVVPLEVPTACFLGALSCAVGRSRAVSIKPGWLEHGNLWLCLVAESGVGKTPCAAALFKPLREAEFKRFKEWQDAMNRYHEQKQNFKRSKDGEGSGEAPVKPIRVQYTVEDATPEAVSIVLEQNPRGVLWRADELAGMIANLDRYAASGREGGTRSRLLSAYDCQEWKTNRTDAERNQYVPAACVSIFGGIQPGILTRVFEGHDVSSGFLPRMIFIRAERSTPPLWTDACLSSKSEELLYRILTRLLEWDVDMTEDGGTRPKVLHPAPSARALYVEWHNQLALESWVTPGESGLSTALLDKLRGQCLRLCLLLHCADLALQGKNHTESISEGTMRRAILLANWIKSHQIQTWRLFATEQRARLSTPLERAVILSVVKAEKRIEELQYRMPNNEFIARVQEHLPIQAEPRSIGKAATNLGIAQGYVGHSRARVFNPELLATFREYVGHAVHDGETGKPKEYCTVSGDEKTGDRSEGITNSPDTQRMD